MIHQNIIGIESTRTSYIFAFCVVGGHLTNGIGLQNFNEEILSGDLSYGNVSHPLCSKAVYKAKSRCTFGYRPFADFVRKFRGVR